MCVDTTERSIPSILASARGERVSQIARQVGCNDRTVRNAIYAFNITGLACLVPGSSRRQTIQADFSTAGVTRLRALLHQVTGPFSFRWSHCQARSAEP
jgi:hypothetical protein